MIRRVKAALLCVIVAMTVSACGLDAGMTIKDEDTLDFALTVTFTKAELALSGTSGSSCTDLLRESDMDSEGYDEETGYYYRVEDRSSGGDFSCALIFEDISLDEANSRVDPSEQLHISHTGDTWVATFENIYEYQRDFPGMSAVEVLNSTYAGAGDAMQDALDMTVSITMPEPITSVTPSSGATISGNTVVIDTLEVDDEGSLQITAEKTFMSSFFGLGASGGSGLSRKVAGIPLGVLILMCLLLVLAIAVVVFAVNRRKKRSGAAPYSQQLQNPYYPHTVQAYPPAPGFRSAQPSQPLQGFPAPQAFQNTHSFTQGQPASGYPPSSEASSTASALNAQMGNPYQQPAQPYPGLTPGVVPDPHFSGYQQLGGMPQQPSQTHFSAPSQMPPQASPEPGSGNESQGGAASN